MPKGIRAAATVAGLFALAIATTACTQNESAGQASAPSSGTSQATAGSGTAQAPLAAGSANQGSATNNTSNSCAGSDFAVEMDVQPSQAGTFLVVVTNNSGKTCTLTGWLDLAGQDASGEAHELNVNKVAEPGPPTEVALAPGAAAFAGMQVEPGDKADVNTSVVTGFEATLPGVNGPAASTTIVPADGLSWEQEPDPTIPVKSVQLGTLQPTRDGVLPL